MRMDAILNRASEEIVLVVLVSIELVSAGFEAHRPWSSTLAAGAGRDRHHVNKEPCTEVYIAVHTARCGIVTLGAYRTEVSRV